MRIGGGLCNRERMRRQRSRVVWLLGAMACASGSESGEWPIHRGDAGLRGVAAAPLSAPLRRVWTARVAAAPNSSPIVVGGRVFIGSASNALVALDARTGQQLWAAPTGHAADAPPLAFGSVVGVGTERGDFIVVRQSDGRGVWR